MIPQISQIWAKTKKELAMKNRIFLGTVLVASLVSGALAQGLFVGAEGNYIFKSKLSQDISIPSVLNKTNNELNDEQMAVGLKVGYDFDSWRVYGAYMRNLKANEDELQSYNKYEWSGNDFLVGADWTPKFNLFSQELKGTVGAYGGYSVMDITTSYNNYSADYTQNGCIYGLRLGVAYDINQNNEIEFGVKYNEARYKDKEVAFKIEDTKRTNSSIFVGIITNFELLA